MSASQTSPSRPASYRATIENLTDERLIELLDASTNARDDGSEFWFGSFGSTDPVDRPRHLAVRANARSPSVDQTTSWVDVADLQWSVVGLFQMLQRRISHCRSSFR